MESPEPTQRSEHTGPGKRRRKHFSVGRVIGLLILIVVGLPALWLGTQWIGPRADVPTEDPLLRLNREYGDVRPNAASLYAAAYDAATQSPIEAWKRRRRTSVHPLTPEVTAWIDENIHCVELMRQASETDGCYFRLQRDHTASADLTEHEQVKTLARLLRLRTRLAVERRDLDTLEDSLRILAGIARHLGRQPIGAIANLHSTAVLSLVHEHMLMPYTWADVTDARRVQYARTLGSTFEPPAGLDATLSADRDEYCWTVATAEFGRAERFVPRSRFYGEIDRVFDVYRSIARQSIEAQLDPTNPLWEKAAGMHAWPESKLRVFFNLPRALGAMAPQLETTFRLRGRLIARQRGNRTVMALFEYRNGHGTFPEGLDALEAEFVVDPYTGEPFEYRLTEGGFTLYSRGADQDDDDGAHNMRFGEPAPTRSETPPPPDGDYVFWPLPEPGGS